ncbi:LEA_2 domain-containing protein [Cephalotus follicularis]|uniref:LEA_2 domain-containing protein n=1 Tax=Cephalotus follicularis TaxID=3775 RepID=A0A1Q3C4D2_CEPFO|nr:LEA_2 domain-containing protein [Cephalotus follicularis]
MPETNRQYHETNPHFRPTELEEQHFQPPGPWVSRPQRQDQRARQPQSPQPRGQDQHTQPPQPRERGQYSQPQGPRVLQPQHDQIQRPNRPSFGVKQPHQQGQKHGLPQDQSSPWVKIPPPGQHPGTHSPPVPPALHQGDHPQTHGRQVPPLQRQDHRSRLQGLVMPQPRPTRCITWSAAIFCAIFWVVIILGGLVVLIVYLVFRPRSPRFDVSSVTLNAAYLDMGYLLNADLRLLANFTNPNKKVSVDFSYVTLDLYYANTLIATQYIVPFKAAKRETKFADVHMVTSQVRLPLQESELLKKQIDSNRVLFEVKGVFHARSIFGNLLGYSYRLYAHCNIEVTSPPSGVLRAGKCRTKR